MKRSVKSLVLSCVTSAACAVSIPAFAQTLEDSVIARLNALEKKNVALENENAALRGRVNRLEVSKTAKPDPRLASAEYKAPYQAKAPAGPDFYDGRPVSNFQPRFEASASLLFLQPGGGNLEYGTLVTPLPLPTPNWANQS